MVSAEGVCYMRGELLQGKMCEFNRECEVLFALMR